MLDVRKQHAGQLDAFRAIAVLAVIFTHTIDDRYSIGEYRFMAFGGYGVCLFFVLSAYLITSQLLATQDDRAARGDPVLPPLLEFYGKRALRLFPAYYLAIIVAAALGLGEMRREFPWHAAQLSELLFALDRHAQDTSVAGHFWSLSVEWQFYLIWPWLVMSAPRKVLLAAMAAMLLVAAYVWTPFVPVPEVIQRTGWLQSFDSLATGALLAYAQHRGWRLDWLPRLAVPAAVLCVAGLALPAFGHGGAGKLAAMPAHELMNFVFAAAVYQATQPFRGPVGWALDRPLLQYAGKISYGVYVYHIFILTLYLQVFAALGVEPLDWGVGCTLLIAALSFATAAISWRFVEQPINRLRRFVTYPPKPQPC